MKKIILILAAAGFAAQANATALCTGGSSANKQTVTAAAKFVKNNFPMNCSANVILDYSEDNATAWTASASKKGACYYIGNTNGGAPKQLTATCNPNTPDFTSASDPTPNGKLNDAQALGS